MKPFAPNSKRDPKSVPVLFGAICLGIANGLIMDTQPQSNAWQFRQTPRGFRSDHETPSVRLAVATSLLNLVRSAAQVSDAGL
ncbi:hypothetical protein C8D87_104426 [Lentzea atacamensis]|uniref:Uncharacterized protein n=1 Tax=Lentzea atacamensis TaxID=531938 RepID=A0ABX9EBJ6_9PSEU|nr:hypothetical protein C8D87_104426 [Lentzea atacamensis]